MIATGYITTNGNTGNVVPPSGARQAFPGTFAVWGTFGGATVKLQAGFLDNANSMQWFDVGGTSATAAAVVNISVRCDALRINCAAGAGQNIGYWIG